MQATAYQHTIKHYQWNIDRALIKIVNNVSCDIYKGKVKIWMPRKQLVHYMKQAQKRKNEDIVFQPRYKVFLFDRR